MKMFTTARAAATTRNDFYDGNDGAKNTEKERMIKFRFVPLSSFNRSFSLSLAQILPIAFNDA